MAEKKVWTRRHFLKMAGLGLAATGVAACAPQEQPTPTPAPQPESKPAAAAPKKLKAAWVYVGPVGDYGWTFAHDLGRKFVEEKFPWLETTYVESVAEGDAMRIIDRFIQEEDADVVFTTSFGYMDDTIKAGEKYPDKIFFHCSGYKRRENVGTYFAEFYQLYYLNGLMAGALTKSNKLGYVAAHPIPEVVRHINAFALGAREVNPDATVDVRWLFSWFDPAKAREAAESMIAQGVDVLAFTEDTPTVIEVAQEYTEKGQPVYSFAHYSSMQRFGEDACVSGQLVNWGVLYLDILAKVYAGAYTPKDLADVDYWWMLREKAVELGSKRGVPINPKFEGPLKEKKVKDPILGEISVYDLIFTRMEQMAEETVVFDPFSGPIRDQDGKERIPAGTRATHDDLWTMDYFVEGVIGKLEKPA